MTKSQTRLHKLGNAIRAFKRGFKFISVGKTRLDGKPVSGPRDHLAVYLPEKMAEERVKRWLFRCQQSKDIMQSDAERLAAALAK